MTVRVALNRRSQAYSALQQQRHQRRVPVIAMHDVAARSPGADSLRARLAAGRGSADAHPAQTCTASVDRRPPDNARGRAATVESGSARLEQREAIGMRARAAARRSAPPQPASASSAAAPMLEYSGMNTRTSWPRDCRYRGSAPATSARPPVLASGATSEAMKQIAKGHACGEVMPYDAVSKPIATASTLRFVRLYRPCLRLVRAAAANAASIDSCIFVQSSRF